MVKAATKKVSAKKTAAKKLPTKKAPTRKKTSARSPVRPWIKHYPDGITWNDPLNTTPIHERVLAASDKNPTRDALDFLGAKTSFASLASQIRAFAGALQTQFGVKKGSRVALMLPNTPFYPVAYYAVLLAGGTVINCNPLYTKNELSHIIDNAGTDIMVTLDLKLVFEKAEALCQTGPIKKLIVCEFASALPFVKSILFKIAKRGDIADLNNSAVADHITHFDKLIAAGYTPKPVKINPEKDVAVQQYTGGTTGLPKGAMLSHANISANVSQIDIWGYDLFSPPSKIVAVLPFFHIFSMTVCMNTPLSNGAEVVMLPRFELGALLNLLMRTGANVMPAVPTLTHALAVGKQTTSEKIASLEVIISGGAALPQETRDEFSRVSKALLAEGYGLTECSPVVCCSALRVPSKDMSIGQPLPGTDIRFIDLENPKKVVPQGERGELVVKGQQVMLGYYQNPEATKDTFIDGWFRTGDVGYMDEDGYVFLVDRIKDLIICSGFNVYPRNIEEAIYKHPAVDECNVIGVKDTYRGEAPVAFVKLKSGATADAAEIKKFLIEHISKIEMPRDIIFKDELPKTLIGKLSKKELREEYEQMKEQTSEQA